MNNDDKSINDEDLEKKLRRRLILKRLLYVVLIVAYVVGVVGAVQWIGKTTYVSENALSPHAAGSGILFEYVNEAMLYTEKLQQASAQLEEAVKLLAEVTTERVEGPRDGIVWSKVKGRVSDGSEALIIAAPIGEEDRTGTGLSGSGLTLAMASYLRSVGWLSRDVVILLYQRENSYENVRRWLDGYLNDDDVIGGDGFFRGGLVLDFPPLVRWDRISLYYEGENNELPNLDLINTIVRILPRTSLNGPSVRHLPLLMDLVRPFAKFIQREIGISLPQPISQLVALYTFMVNQAMGTPTGEHAIFNKYHIDVVTLSLEMTQASAEKVVASQQDGMQMFYFMRAVEMTLRCLNNIIEHLHQSFYYYMLAAPDCYVSIGLYMIPFGLCALSLPINALLLAYDGTGIATAASIAAPLLLLLGHFAVGAVLLLAFYFLQPLLIAVALFALGFLWFRLPSFDQAQQRLFHMWLLAIALLVLATLSLVNFSLAYILTMLMIPFLSFCSSGASAGFLRGLLQGFLLLLLNPLSPIALAYFFSSEASSPAVFFSSLREQWLLYNTLLVPIFSLVYVPCWLGSLSLLTLK